MTLFWLGTIWVPIGALGGEPLWVEELVSVTAGGPWIYTEVLPEVYLTFPIILLEIKPPNEPGSSPLLDGKDVFWLKAFIPLIITLPAQVDDCATGQLTIFG